MMVAAQMTFANLPLAVMAVADSKEVAIVRQSPFPPFWDEGVPAAFFAEGNFSIGAEGYEYEKTYKLDECPLLVQWLRRQQFKLVSVAEVVKVQ